jgi:hypothetical protein
MRFNDTHDPASPPSDLDRGFAEPPARMYIHEAGWRISVKRGSTREFCHVMAPDQDYYHRLGDGEIYLHQADERICLACATRRGIISREPRRLRDESPKFLADAGQMPLRVAGLDEGG